MQELLEGLERFGGFEAGIFRIFEDIASVVHEISPMEIKFPPPAEYNDFRNEFASI